MTTIGKGVPITWVGHGTFHLVTPEGRGVIIDPWLEGNPSCPEELKAKVRENLAVIYVTHAHFDHINDVAALAKETGAMVVCQYDMFGFFAGKGVPEAQIVGMNKGGTVTVADIRATMTNAHHSSSFSENGQLVIAGSPAGFVLRFSNGFALYFAGDTNVTMDMQIIGDLYAPDLSILPIGDHFTMGVREAAYALKLLRTPLAIGAHWGTFPLLHGNPEAWMEACKEFGVTTQIIPLRPGETVE